MRSKGKYELIIKWTSGEKESYFYHNRKFTNLVRDNMSMVFGNQIEWIGIIEWIRIAERDHQVVIL